jgi:hypothetical protein
VEVGAAEDADLDATLGMETFYGLASGEYSPSQALADGKVTLAAGEPATFERFFDLFSFASRRQTAA